MFRVGSVLVTEVLVGCQDRGREVFWLGGLSVCFWGFSGGSLMMCSDSGSERDGSVLPSFGKVTWKVYFA